MTKVKGITFGLALLISSALTGPCFADAFNFSYSFLGGVNSISASGTLMVGDLDPGSGGFPILSIVGTRTVNGVDMAITGLTSYFGNDNLLFYPDPPFLDFDGMSFTVDNQSLSDDGFGDVNVYFDEFGSGMYTEVAGGVNPGDFEVSPMSAASPSPEPSATMLLICGLLGLAVTTRGRWRLCRSR